MAGKQSRGLLVVVEGLDRSGKSTQCQFLHDHLVASGRSVRYQKFPDRTTPTGQMINAYLTNKSQQDDHSIHLLFSANRWEAVRSIQESILNGTTVIVDRFSFSGAVYSAAKGNPNLDLEWAWYPEIGLPQPDVTFFLDIASADAAKRGGYGEERYENEKMQMRVRVLFQQLFARLPSVKVYTVDAGQEMSGVSRQMAELLDKSYATAPSKGPLSKLPILVKTGS